MDPHKDAPDGPAAPATNPEGDRSSLMAWTPLPATATSDAAALEPRSPVTSRAARSQMTGNRAWNAGRTTAPPSVAAAGAAAPIARTPALSPLLASPPPRCAARASPAPGKSTLPSTRPRDAAGGRAGPDGTISAATTAAWFLAWPWRPHTHALGVAQTERTRDLSTSGCTNAESRRTTAPWPSVVPPVTRVPDAST